MNRNQAIRELSNGMIQSSMQVEVWNQYVDDPVLTIKNLAIMAKACAETARDVYAFALNLLEHNWSDD